MHKQWAAGAPVIGAAPVPSGRPKRPWPEGLSGGGALQLFFERRKRKETRETQKGTSHENKTAQSGIPRSPTPEPGSRRRTISIFELEKNDTREYHRER